MSTAAFRNTESFDHVEESDTERRRRLIDEAEADWLAALTAQSALRDEALTVDFQMQKVSSEYRRATLLGQPTGDGQVRFAALKSKRDEFEEKLKAAQTDVEAKKREMDSRNANVARLSLAEAFERQPKLIEQWVAVVHAHRHILEELRHVSTLTLTSLHFGSGLLPDLNNPVIGSNRYDVTLSRIPTTSKE